MAFFLIKSDNQIIRALGEYQERRGIFVSLKLWSGLTLRLRTLSAGVLLVARYNYRCPKQEVFFQEFNT